VWLSLHCEWWGEDAAVKARLAEVMNLYGHVYLGLNKLPGPVRAEDLHGLQEFLLSPVEVAFLRQ